jgi:SAM-dependent methyltransferase
MAPEVALDKIRLLTRPGDLVLDPMCGSGTVVRLAVEQGRRSIGADLDPLAIFITRSTCSPGWSADLEKRAVDVVRRAKRLGVALPPWIASNAETQGFVEYWFGQEQIDCLARLARVLMNLPRKGDPLRVALSRLIVTKDVGASLARDTAHSRPHRVRDENDFDVFEAYVASARRLESLATPLEEAESTHVRRADARVLSFVETGSVDLVVTSPPYLNAIDYLRGHRMSLVWLGWTVSDLRCLRAETIGAERSLHHATPATKDLAKRAVPRLTELPDRQQGMVMRFAHDIDRLSRSLGRVVKKGGHAVLVVADSQFSGVPIENSSVCRLAASRHGFTLKRRQVRPLASHHRYLPPPGSAVGSLSQRMREEVILTFSKTESIVSPANRHRGNPRS